MKGLTLSRKGNPQPLILENTRIRGIETNLVRASLQVRAWGFWRQQGK